MVRGREQGGKGQTEIQEGGNRVVGNGRGENVLDEGKGRGRSVEERKVERKGREKRYSDGKERGGEGRGKGR